MDTGGWAIALRTPRRRMKRIQRHVRVEFAVEACVVPAGKPREAWI